VTVGQSSYPRNCTTFPFLEALLPATEKLYRKAAWRDICVDSRRTRRKVQLTVPFCNDSVLQTTQIKQSYRCRTTVVHIYWELRPSRASAGTSYSSLTPSSLYVIDRHWPWPQHRRSAVVNGGRHSTDSCTICLRTLALPATLFLH